MITTHGTKGSIDMKRLAIDRRVCPALWGRWSHQFMWTQRACWFYSVVERESAAEWEETIAPHWSERTEKLCIIWCCKRQQLWKRSVAVINEAVYAREKKRQTLGVQRKKLNKMDGAVKVLGLLRDRPPKLLLLSEGESYSLSPFQLRQFDDELPSELPPRHDAVMAIVIGIKNVWAVDASQSQFASTARIIDRVTAIPQFM